MTESARRWHRRSGETPARTARLKIEHECSLGWHLPESEGVTWGGTRGGLGIFIATQEEGAIEGGLEELA